MLEDVEMLGLYKTILSHPLATKVEFNKDPIPAGAYAELHLSIIQAYSSLWQTVKNRMSEVNPDYIIKHHWRDFTLTSLRQTYLDALSYLNWYKNGNPEKSVVIEFNRADLEEETVATILELKQNEAIKKEFKKFLQNDKKAKARLIKYWGGVAKTMAYLERHEQLREIIGKFIFIRKF